MDEDLPQNAFQFWQGETFSEEEMEILRKRAWQEQGIFILSIEDPRLDRIERAILSVLANRVYGQGR